MTEPTILDALRVTLTDPPVLILTIPILALLAFGIYREHHATKQLREAQRRATAPQPGHDITIRSMPAIMGLSPRYQVECPCGWALNTSTIDQADQQAAQHWKEHHA